MRGARSRAVLIAFLASWPCSLILARAQDPPETAATYLVGAARSRGALGVGDASPLYLELCQLLAPLGPHAVLQLQCLFHAVTAACVAASVAMLAPPRWALMAGLIAASYRPLLVHCGIPVPETTLVTLLAGALLLAVLARRYGEPSAGDPRATGHGRTAAAAAGAALCLSSAALLRPHYVLLVPVWALWIAAPASRRRRAGLKLLVVVTATLVVGSAARSPVVWRHLAESLDPGAIAFEGNGPAASGLGSHPPGAIRALVQAHPDAPGAHRDAYRRIAAYENGAEPGNRGASGTWTELTLEALASAPGRPLGLAARKTLMALMPREAHDLALGAELDRRVRARLPWGFGVLLICLPWLLLTSRRTLGDLIGPLALSGLSIAYQILFFTSSSQRLPLALALLILGPVLASTLGRSPRPRLRTGLALGSSLALLIGLLGLAGPIAVADEATWARHLGPAGTGPGERLASWHDGRALHGFAAREHANLDTALEVLRAGRLREAHRLLRNLSGRGRDYTIDDTRIGVPEYWLALVRLRLGNPPGALEAVREAARIRPGEIEIQALKLRLEGPAELAEPAEGWRPAGWDSVTARWALARAAALLGEHDLAAELIAPLAEAFPELTRTPPGVDL